MTRRNLNNRVPLVDWSEDIPRHWNGGDPAATHAFNALSLLFPRAESYFIKVVRETIDLPGSKVCEELAFDVAGFVAQESTHRRVHERYNAVLEHQGYENVAANWIASLQDQATLHFSVLTRLAIVCAYEHYTAILGNYILSNSRAMEGADRKMALVWGWHGAEETEHKAVCFELYRAAGGGWLRRVLSFMLVSVNFALMYSRVYAGMLVRDGCFETSRVIGTLGLIGKFFFGRSGVGWHLMRHGVSFLSPMFHPWNEDNRAKLDTWLAANESRLISGRER